MDQSAYIRENILEAKSYIDSRCGEIPDTALVFGSGMAEALPDLDEATVISYSDIPHFPGTEIAGHRGELVCGRLGEKRIVAMLGRFHYYEGYTLRGATFPIQVLSSLGASSLILTCAAGGIGEKWRPGDFMLVEDHINLMGSNPLIGPNDETLGPRFIDMTGAYDPALAKRAMGIADSQGIDYHSGVLAAVTGPSYETAAEINFLKMIGADAVTMSTVPETIVARHLGMKVLGISLISNIAVNAGKLNHNDVLAVANRSSETLKRWLAPILTAAD